MTSPQCHVLAVVNLHVPGSNKVQQCDIIVDESNEISLILLIDQSSSVQLDGASSSRSSSANLHSNSSVQPSNNQSINQSINQTVKLKQCSKSLLEGIRCPPSSYCMKCRHWFCTDHSNVHDRLSDRPEHQTHTINEYLTSPSIKQSIDQLINQSVDFPPFLCKIHRLSLEAYCVDCEQYIFVRCNIIDQSSIFQHSQAIASSSQSINHRDHPCVLLREKRNQDVAGIIDQSLLDQLDAQIHRLMIENEESVRLVDQMQIKALDNINQSISRLQLIRDVLSQNLQKIRQRVRASIKLDRAALPDKQSSVQENHIRLDHLINQLKVQSNKQDFIALQRSLLAIDRLIADNQKKMSMLEDCQVERLIIQFDRNFPHVSVHRPIFANRSNNGASDMFDVVDQFASVHQSILLNWFSVRIRHSTQRHETISQPVDISETPPVDEHASNQTASICSKSNNISITQTLLQDELFAVDEPHALSWQDLLTRMRSKHINHSIAQSADVQYHSYIRSSQNYFRPQTVDQLKLYEVCQDLFTLSIDSAVNSLRLEQVDWDMIGWFIVYHLLGNGLANFEYLAAATLHLLINRHSSLPVGRGNGIGVLTVIMQRSSPHWMWKYRLAWAFGIFMGGGPGSLLSVIQRTLSPLVIGFAHAEVIPHLKHAHLLKAVYFSPHSDDSTIQKLTSGLRYLTELRTLECCVERVSSSTTNSLLTNAAKYCQNLTSLVLRGCELLENRSVIISAFRAMTSLTSLSLEDSSSIVHALVGLRHLQSLSSLSLRSSTVDDASCNALAEALPQLPMLTNLDLFRCSISQPSGCERMMTSITECAQLNQLRISGHELTRQSTSLLIAGLKHLTRLQRISLNTLLNPDLEFLSDLGHDIRLLDLAFSDKFDSAYLGSALSRWQQLRVLRLSHCSLSHYSKICSALSCCTNLVELMLDNTGMDTATAVVLSLQFKHLSKLVKFSVGENKLHKKSAGIIAKSLHHLTLLEYLDVSPSRIAGPEFRDALKVLLRLRHLNMAGINLEDGPCEVVAEGFNSWAPLNYLDISHNRLTPSSYVDLADGLFLLTDLREFVAQNCDMTHKVVLGISLTVRRWPGLDTFDISNNNVGDDGISIIMRDLSKCNALLSICKFDKCGFGDRGMKTISSHALALHSLRVLSVSNNKISSREIKRAAAELATVYTQPPRIGTILVADALLC